MFTFENASAANPDFVALCAIFELFENSLDTLNQFLSVYFHVLYTAYHTI